MSIHWSTRADEDWLRLAPCDPEAVLAADVRTDFHAKQDRSIARWDLGGLTVYLKRHFRESRLRGWLATIWRQPGWSAAWQEYEHLCWARDQGFRVPRPVAAGESVGPAGRLRGYLAVEALTGMLPLHQLIPLAEARLPAAAFQLWKRGLVTELARVVRQLHQLRAFHKDLYLCHFYAAEKSISVLPPHWYGQLAMIDLHRLGRHPLTWPWWQLKDLAQLLYSTDVAGVTARDRLSFWKLYAGQDRHSGWGALARRLILVRYRNYRGHNVTRRAAA